MKIPSEAELIEIRKRTAGSLLNSAEELRDRAEESRENGCKKHAEELEFEAEGYENAANEIDALIDTVRYIRDELGVSRAR